MPNNFSVDTVSISKQSTLQEPILGTFVFHSNKAARLHNAAQGRCVAHMFAMRVEEELPVWPEQKHRERIWVSLFWNVAVGRIWCTYSSDTSAGHHVAAGLTSKLAGLILWM